MTYFRFLLSLLTFWETLLKLTALKCYWNWHSMYLEWENSRGKLQIISGKFQNSRKFQNNAINDVKQILLSHVIILQNTSGGCFCFFSTQPQCCLTFSWIEVQMLLKYCLIYITIIILKYIWYLVYLYPCQILNLFMSYLYHLFFVFNFFSLPLII